MTSVPMSKRHASVHEDVGQRLRAHRESRRLSLRELARRIGLSPSAISQIETGKSRPSVSTLYAIVTELQMSLDELFSDEQPKQAARTPARSRSKREGAAAATDERHVQRAERRDAIDLESGVRWERLTQQADPDVDFLYVVYDVGGSSSESGRFNRHGGHEYGLVLDGALEVTVGFDTYELGPGDSISFDSMVPHRLRNTGTEPCHGVWFVRGRQDDARTEELAAAGETEA